MVHNGNNDEREKEQHFSNEVNEPAGDTDEQQSAEDEQHSSDEEQLSADEQHAVDDELQSNEEQPSAVEEQHVVDEHSSDEVQPSADGELHAVDDETAYMTGQSEEEAADHANSQENNIEAEDVEEDEAAVPYSDDSDWDGTPKRYKTVLAVFSTFLIMFCLVAGIGIGVVAYGLKMLTPTEPGDEPVRITIPAGSSSSRIAVILEENGLIRHQKMFGYYLRYKNEGRQFQAGTYDMYPGMEIDDIIDQLNRGDTVKIEMIRFTIQEGLTVQQIAEKLSEEGHIDAEVFLDLMHNPSAIQSSSNYLKHIPTDAPDLRVPLEGYLFPETYEMKKGSSEQEIVQRLTQELDRKLATLPVGWEAQLDELGLTFHEMMTIASMIEREVVVDAERSIVSGVIHNRIKLSMPLQIDATVQYALGEHREIVSIEDTKYESPYNTYAVQGLPPGPIAAPGIKSIRAALYPEDTEYLYYVTKKDGTHEHYFAKTYEQHQRNINLSKNN